MRWPGAHRAGRKWGAKNIVAVLAREGTPPQVDQLPGRRSRNRSKRQRKPSWAYRSVTAAAYHRVWSHASDASEEPSPRVSCRDQKLCIR
jgi:hypothetical protein